MQNVRNVALMLMLELLGRMINCKISVGRQMMAKAKIIPLKDRVRTELVMVLAEVLGRAKIHLTMDVSSISIRN